MLNTRTAVSVLVVSLTLLACGPGEVGEALPAANGGGSADNKSSGGGTGGGAPVEGSPGGQAGGTADTGTGGGSTMTVNPMLDSGTSANDSGTPPPPVDAGSPKDAGTVIDAGPPKDAGSVVDAGAPKDAGSVVDAGAPKDAGTPPKDAGTVIDAGAPKDAGTPPPPIDAGAPKDAGLPVNDAGSGPVVVIGAAGDLGGTATSDIIFNNPTVYDAALTLGDNSYSSSYTLFNSSWGRLKPKLRPSAGNHDYSYVSNYYAAVGDAGAGVVPGTGYYSYDLGAWHLIALNSNIDMSLSGAQVKWLKADLAANASKKCVLAYWHHPRWSSSTSHGNQSQTGPLWDVLYAANADVVLGGHDHTYERFTAQDPNQKADPARGITEYVVGTGGVGFYALATNKQPYSAYSQASKFGILKMTLKPTGWDSEFVPINGGASFDKVSGVCH